MILIMDSTTKQANNVNKLGVNIQVNFHLHEQVSKFSVGTLAQSMSLSSCRLSALTKLPHSALPVLESLKKS